MPDKKISQLTAATTPLGGTEEIPLVQGGVTKKVSVNNLTAGKDISALNVTATTAVNALTVEVTNISAKDKTPSLVINDTTGLISTSNNVWVGTTSSNFANAGARLHADGLVALTRSGNYPLYLRRIVNDGDVAVFINSPGSIVGAITISGSTTTYNTSSDYRLKNFIGDVTDSGSRIDALKPVEFSWKADGTRARGFFAHEFQQVYPNSVTGSKDAVDDENKPVYQSMQASTSEVISDLVAEIKSLRARVAVLEANNT